MALRFKLAQEIEELHVIIIVSISGGLSAAARHEHGGHRAALQKLLIIPDGL
jgi:hypothetical protein